MHWGMTMTDDNKMTDAALEAMFEGARAAPPVVPEALMARVMADAGAMQPVAQRSVWREWFSTLGGLSGMGGLITASCLGFWIGVAPPQGLPDLAGSVFGVPSLLDSELDDEFDGDMLTAYGWDIEEG